jgi:hypothetical protein
MQFSVCFLDITNFPYDIHQCSLTYRSWTYDHQKVLLTFKDNNAGIDMTSYIVSNEWKVTPLEATHTITQDTYSFLNYTMVIQRKGGLYGYILILPCLLLSVATMVVFWIPPESPAKMILTVSIFSGLFLLLLLLAESIPGIDRSTRRRRRRRTSNLTADRVRNASNVRCQATSSVGKYEHTACFRIEPITYV